MKEQKDNHRFTLRLPPKLRARLEQDAERNERTLTAEIIVRLTDLPTSELVQQLLRENAELKAMVRQLAIDR